VKTSLDFWKLVGSLVGVIQPVGGEMLLMLSPLFVFFFEGWKRQPLQIHTQISCLSGCEGPSEPHFWHDFRDPVAYSHGPVRGAMGPEVEEHVQESALGEENR